eukprot:3351936-Pyramimonas_sp.AAC.1
MAFPPTLLDLTKASEKWSTFSWSRRPSDRFQPVCAPLPAPGLLWETALDHVENGLLLTGRSWRGAPSPRLFLRFSSSIPSTPRPPPTSPRACRMWWATSL